MTESPGFTPAAISASQSASVPEAQPTACPKNETLRIANSRDSGQHLFANAVILPPQVEQGNRLRRSPNWRGDRWR
jgi:hypothetical protein